ncbi:hypothetical protein PAPHI01_0909 [Pancytospora philotis]|nr:hypothetical protein PAPHI01_0909 [Pancytospora philotis]
MLKRGITCLALLLSVVRAGMFSSWSSRSVLSPSGSLYPSPTQASAAEAQAALGRIRNAVIDIVNGASDSYYDGGLPWLSKMRSKLDQNDKFFMGLFTSGLNGRRPGLEDDLAKIDLYQKQDASLAMVSGYAPQSLSRAIEHVLGAFKEADQYSILKNDEVVLRKMYEGMKLMENDRLDAPFLETYSSSPLSKSSSSYSYSRSYRSGSSSGGLSSY